MGLYRFSCEPKSILQDEASLHRGYLVSADGRIHSAAIEVTPDGIEIRRPTSESTRLNIPWEIRGLGLRMVSTASLPERELPYLLPLELARGKIVQFRNQSAAWSMAGMKIPESAVDAARDAYRDFSQAAAKQAQTHVSCELAQLALQKIFAAADELVKSYAAQSMAGRRQKYPHVPVAVGCTIPAATLTGNLEERFLLAFGISVIDLSWKILEEEEGNIIFDKADAQLDWAEKNRLNVRAGPLVDFGANGVPSWVNRWASDFYNLETVICNYVETVMGRYGGRIRQWEVLSRINSGGALSLNEEARLAIAVQVLEAARQVDEEAMLSIRIDQPWGDYQARGQHRLAPLQLVDAMIRSGVALSGITLDLAVGYVPRGSICRDLIEVSRMIDSWSVLGVPLTISLASPSRPGIDTFADADLEVQPQVWASGCDESSQVRWVSDVLPLVMAKPSVVAVLWNNFLDSDRHEYPHAGLIRVDGTAKPSFERVYELRQATV